MEFLIENSEGDLWSNEIGWTGERSDASRFSREEKETLRLPMGGQWKPMDLDQIINRNCIMRGLPIESAYADAIDLGGILGVALSDDPESEAQASRAIGEAFHAYREEIQTARIARAFSGILRGYLGPRPVAEINRRNRAAGWPDGACASHDACDANILMKSAFKLIMHRAPQPDSRADADMWSRAWNMAKQRGFPVF